MLLRLLMISVFLSPCGLRAQSPARPDTTTRPPILGTLENGIYSNPTIGFELRLDPECSFADEARAIASSTGVFAQRLSVTLRCSDRFVILNSYPLHPDEPDDLAMHAEITLAGAMDGGGFQRRGSWLKQTSGKTQLWTQELTRNGDLGQEVGFYCAFMIGRRFVFILAIGPKANRSKLSQISTALTIAPK